MTSGLAHATVVSMNENWQNTGPGGVFHRLNTLRGWGRWSLTSRQGGGVSWCLHINGREPMSGMLLDHHDAVRMIEAALLGDAPITCCSDPRPPEWKNDHGVLVLTTPLGRGQCSRTFQQDGSVFWKIVLADGTFTQGTFGEHTTAIKHIETTLCKTKPEPRSNNTPTETDTPKTRSLTS